MAALFPIVQLVLGFLLPISGFYLVVAGLTHPRAARRWCHPRRRPERCAHRRLRREWRAPFLEVLPWALVGLVWGAGIGLVGVLAF